MSGERTAVSSLDGVTSSSPGELGTPAPALVARTVEIDPARVEDLLALLPTDDPVSWVRRDEGLVGWGRAAELRTAGAARFEDAATWWSELTSRAVVRDEVTEPGTGLVCFGTFAFADEPGDEGAVGITVTGPLAAASLGIGDAPRGEAFVPEDLPSAIAWHRSAQAL